MPPRLAYLVSEDWYFVSHRLPMARAARDAGFEVHVITRVVNCGQRIEREGFVLHPIAWSRGSLHPLRTLATLRAVRALYRALKPDIVHHVALVPSLIGSTAALGLPMAKLNALAGLGFIFTSDSVKARLLRPIAVTVLRFLLNRPNTTVLVQNPDDATMVAKLGVARSRIAIIPGSGVDTDVLKPTPEPPAPVTVGFVGRLLKDKGIVTLVRAHDLLRKRGAPVRILVAGTPDPSNPASISQETLAAWRHHDGIEMLGHVSDIAGFWAKAHIAVLPSRREGLPKSLLEAAACGRPIVATDVPGCREVARQGANALLVPVNDDAALANAIAALAEDAGLRAQLGAAGRTLAESEFSSARIGAAIVALYRKLLP
ncbi:MAG: glycosyltransferase family 4 protein [Pseudolabrys sp.]